MHFVKGAEVYTASGEKIGTLSRVVIDAKTKDVTDLVVERGVLTKEEKVIPVGLVDLETEDRITLGETNQNIDDFLDYETTYYVPLDQAGVPYDDIEALYSYPPAYFQSPVGGSLPGIRPRSVPQTESSIPEGRVTISEGAQVISAEGKHIGNVKQVITDSEMSTVTHFVVGKGFLLKEHKLVPVDWVDKVDDEKVYLSVEARLFERLPDYQAD